ncbi:diguanylate cyclase [Sporohalobacter salinus]|uniref:diguanylate cyclase n=1 Tax=Sporohalobacter salinus TaxID=1494606 RepID=UPI00195FE416|nr:diguanylate cyclase [Sporohalobacter salinus]MBM7623615.1 diguanylate cyclase (GGDEF)-like protein/PAS domain S-box-containing protein [Sporohalobacter salinus]
MERLLKKKRFLVILFIFFILLSFSYSIKAQDLYISELMPINRSVVSDNDGDYDDWLEIHNKGDKAVDLTGYYLSDNPSNIKKWQFPKNNNNKTLIKPGEYLIIWADDETDEGPLHTSFKLSGNGEALILTNPEGNKIIDEFTFPIQKENVSWGRKKGDISKWSYFVIPTPGKVNDTIGIASFKIIELINYILNNIMVGLLFFGFILALIISSILLYIYQKKLNFSKLQLEIQNEKQNLLLNNVQTQIWYLKDPETYGTVNLAHLSFLGKTREEVENRSIYDFINNEEAETWVKKNKVPFIKKSEIKTKEWIRDKNDEKRLLSITKTPKINEDNKVEYVICSAEDITERRRNKQKLKAAKERLELAVEGANLSVWDWNMKTSKIEFNNKWTEMLGYEPEEINISVNGWKELIHEDDKKGVLKKLDKHLNSCTPYYQAEYRVKTKNGNYKWIKDTGKVFKRNKKGNPIRAVGVQQDIDNRKRREEKIRYLSFHDELTGIYNRRYFEKEIKRLNNSVKLPISIIIGDMDKLKLINDNYGHNVGDKFLKKISEIFDEATRNEDVAARIGGDEFAVLLPETDSDIAQKICNRIQDKIKEYNKKEELPETLEISLGSAVKEEKSQDLYEIFNKADQEMYKDK